MRWWLSFADASLPVGNQGLGCAIVEALDSAAAIKTCWALGINPGGEVQLMDVDESAASRLSFSLDPFMNRLIPTDEAKQLSERIAIELAS